MHQCPHCNRIALFLLTGSTYLVGEPDYASGQRDGPLSISEAEEGQALVGGPPRIGSTKFLKTFQTGTTVCTQREISGSPGIGCRAVFACGTSCRYTAAGMCESHNPTAFA